jgi:hypothetical protein
MPICFSSKKHQFFSTSFNFNYENLAEKQEKITAATFAVTFQLF